MEAAQSASRLDPALKRVYRRLDFRKGRASAKVAVARKLVVRLYIMLRDPAVAEIFARRLGWDADQRQAAVESFSRLAHTTGRE